MRRCGLAIAAALFVLGCDPVVSRTIRLTPSPAVSVASGSDSGGSRSEALAAVERIARQFGLTPIASRNPRNCTHQWESEVYQFRSSRLRLGISATPTTDGQLEVSVAEFITTCWSPKGDSLRIALADTLARFGQPRDSEGDDHRSNGRCS